MTPPDPTEREIAEARKALSRVPHIHETWRVCVLCAAEFREWPVPIQCCGQPTKFQSHDRYLDDLAAAVAALLAREREEHERALPPTFYAELPPARRIEMLVERWSRAMERNQELERDLTAARARAEEAERRVRDRDDLRKRLAECEERILALHERAERYAEALREARAKYEPIYQCSTCRERVQLDIQQRATIMCPSCKTYTCALTPDAPTEEQR